MGLLSSLIRSLDDLIAQGYPPEVAERIVSGDLPMDFESRMRRAEAMGFDPSDVQYHGTEADITQFRPSTRGKMGPGVYTTPSQSTANTFSGYPSPYAEGGNVMPLLLRGDYINRADAFDLRPEISGREGQRILNETLEGMGYSGSKAGERGSLAPEKVTFDPRNIRSYLSAAFDPEYTGPNILGATAGTAGALGLLAAPQDAEAGMSKTAAQLLRDEANRLRFGDTDNAVDLSYRGSHQAPDADYGAPLYDLTELIPDDIYGPRGERLYGIGDRAVDAEAFEQLRNARGNPDYETPIYRAVPPGIEDINIGDWVTTSREYARMHGENALGGDYDIIESTAPAKKLQSEGYPYEFGLLPMRPETVIGGGTALGLLAAPEDAEAGFVERGGKTLLEAFHGSPHKFDRFSMDAIGTGEGAQAYGHGLYFADETDVAKQYRDSIVNHRPPNMRVDGKGYGDMSGPEYRASAAVESELRSDPTIDIDTAYERALRDLGYQKSMANKPELYDEDIDALKNLKGRVELDKGHLYRTEIDVTPESLLDWDTPINKQPKEIRDATQNYFDLFRKDEGVAEYLDPIFNDEYEGMTGREFYQTLNNLYSGGYLETPIGNRAADYALYEGNIPAATSFSLLDDNIKGIQYLDGSSRKAGEGTKNYVIFDDNLINIAERGSADPRLLAGTAGAGLLGTAFAPDVRSALEEAGVIGDTLVPTKRPLGERAMGVVDRILTGLEVPQRGLQGLAATGYGLLSGEDFGTAASRGADVVSQGVEESAREFGDYVFDLTGSPAAATAAYTTGIFGSPL